MTHRLALRNRSTRDALLVSQAQDNRERRASWGIEATTLCVTARTIVTSDHSPSWTYIFGLTFSCQAARARVTVATTHQQDSSPGRILGATRRPARLILSRRRSGARDDDVPGFAACSAAARDETRRGSHNANHTTRRLIVSLSLVASTHCAAVTCGATTSLPVAVVASTVVHRRPAARMSSPRGTFTFEGRAARARARANDSRGRHSRLRHERSTTNYERTNRPRPLTLAVTLLSRQVTRAPHQAARSPSSARGRRRVTLPPSLSLAPRLRVTGVRATRTHVDMAKRTRGEIGAVDLREDTGQAPIFNPTTPAARSCRLPRRYLAVVAAAMLVCNEKERDCCYLDWGAFNPTQC